MRRLLGTGTRRAPAVLLGALAVLVTLQVTPAGGQDAERLRVVTVDVTDHPRVSLTVEPPASMAEGTLPADAFNLTENGARVDVEVNGLRSPTATTPTDTLEVVLVIDTSGSMAGAPLAAAKAAATAFVTELPEETAFAVVAFSDKPATVSPLTLGHADVEAAIDGLDASGGTALYDGLQTGVGQFGEGARHALVLLTDGGDTVSQATLDEATEAITDAPIEFAAVELVTPDYDGDVLRNLADATGGEILSTDSPDELARLYRTVASQLVGRYLVSYDTLAGGATDVVLTVTADGAVATTEREVNLPAVDAGVVIEAQEAKPLPKPGWLGSRVSLAIAAALFFLALTVALSWLFLRRREPDVRLAGGRAIRGRGGLRAAFSGTTDRFSSAIERRLEPSGRESRLYALLERGAIDLRPGEFVLIALGSVLGALFLGALVGGPVVGLVLAAVVAFAFPAYLRRRVRRRVDAFADQLADSLQLITGSLRAGHSILQAVDAVAHDAPSPTREEFQRLVMEVRIGRSLGDALRAMRDRIGNEDFEAVVQAVEIHRDVGGDLSEILDTVANTVRARAHLDRQVQSLSAEGRLSAIILLVLPFVVAGIMAIANPDYLAPLFETGLGIGLLVAAAGMLGAGFVWIRRLIRLEY